MNHQYYFPRNIKKIDSSPQITDSNRIITTPSNFAKTNLFYLQEIGILKSLKKHKSHRNSLDSFLIVFVEKGEGVFHYSGKDYYVKENDLVFINCQKDYFHISDDKHPWTLKWIHFNGPNIGSYFDIYINENNSILINNFNIQEFSTHFNELRSKADRNELEIEFTISLLINQILTSLINSIFNNNLTIQKKYFKIEALKEYIDQNFKDKLTLDFLADKFFISKYHMSREFKKKFGVTINTYINIKKITYAKECLRFTDLTIQHISNEINIHDNSYFNKLFKKVEGIPPSSYRKKWNGK